MSKTIEELKAMELFEEYKGSNLNTLTRVPNGWIYSSWVGDNSTTVFIPERISS